ncbi:oxidoreductase [Gangjinia marincola]|uniref:Oxidoreductase n=1 Tax=Gangjinia marincola TaxID=578463 RepID=A0ABN1MHH8_9FLAO
MQKTAIILGATGLVGGKLLDMLLEDNRYSNVKLFSRSSVNRTHPKLTEYLCDLLMLKAEKERFTGDECYCCIGTTKSKTQDKEQYKAIDYGIPKAAAELCAENNIKPFVVISAMGADAGSSIFYNRVKGMMEEAVMDQGISNTIIARPALIGGDRDEKRLGESIMKSILTVVNPLLFGSLKKYRMIYPQEIADAMIWLANNPQKQPVFLSDELQNYARKSYA